MESHGNDFIVWCIPHIKNGLDNKEIMRLYRISDIYDPDKKDSSVGRSLRWVRHVFDELSLYDDQGGEKQTILINKVEKTNDLEIALKSYDIKDTDGLIEWAGIDTEIWECYYKNIHASSNKSNPWFIVDGRFKRRTEVDPIMVIKKMEAIVEQYNPKTIKLPTMPSGNYLLEIDPVDAHIGAMNFDNSETLEDQCDRYKKSVMFMLDKAKGYSLEEIALVVGHDLFNINSNKAETKNGTPQDTIGIPHEVNDTIAKMIIDIVYTMANNAARVNIITVPGNHDFHNVSWLGILLSCVFKDNKNISIDYGIDDRKYHSYGCTSFVYTHKLMKKQEKLSVIMFHEMLERGLITDQTKYYEAHGGHLHEPSKSDFPSETTDQMITQRVLSSLTDSQKYSKDNYGGKVKEAQGFLYHRDKGIECTFTFRDR